MAVGLVHNPTLLQQARHGKKRRRFLGRAALYAKVRVESVLKDLTADSVHVPANIGGEGGKKRRKKGKPDLSIAYLQKFAPDQARDAMGRWMAGSKVVDRKGNPIRVYHATSAPGFSAFNDQKRGTNIPSADSQFGHFFTTNPKYSNRIARFSAKRANTVATIPAYLNIKKPYTMRPKELRSHIFMARPGTIGHTIGRAKRYILEAQGYDGIHVPGAVQRGLANPFTRGDFWIAFKPNQIKGVFNPKPTKSPDFMKFADTEARDAKGRWTREQVQQKLEQHLTGLLAAGGVKTTDKGQTASHINVARFASKRALEMRPKERDKWLRSKLQTHGVLLEHGHKFPGRSLDFIPKPVKDAALRYGPAVAGAAAGGVAGFAAGGPAGAVLGAATGANAGETLRTNFVEDKVKKMLFEKRFFSAARRRKLTQTGDAMPGGRYPIKNQKDLNNAARLSGHSSDQAMVRAHIRAEAAKHGLSLPNSYAKRRVREILSGPVS